MKGCPCGSPSKSASYGRQCKARIQNQKDALRPRYRALGVEMGQGRMGKEITTNRYVESERPALVVWLGARWSVKLRLTGSIPVRGHQQSLGAIHCVHTLSIEKHVNMGMACVDISAICEDSGGHAFSLSYPAALLMSIVASRRLLSHQRTRVRKRQDYNSFLVRRH